MPGGKRRLKQVMTSGWQAGANGNWFDQILAGSVTATVPVFTGNVSPSTEIAEVSITNLGACDILVVQPDQSMCACVVLLGAEAGAGAASLVFRYSASGASNDASTATMRYIAFQLG